MTEPRKAGEVVCLGENRRPHVLARVTVIDGEVSMQVTEGVRWSAAETSAGSSVDFVCKHGPSSVSLPDFAREIRSNPRRARRTVNAKNA